MSYFFVENEYVAVLIYFEGNKRYVKQKKTNKKSNFILNRKYKELLISFEAHRSTSDD